MLKTMFVYILQCSDDSCYTGITNDLTQRIAQHSSGLDRKAYTYPRRPIMLKWSLEVQGPNQAIILEKQIKGWGRKKKEALIENRLEILPFISKNLRERNKQDQ